jgi:methionyl-tRNA formyltransferase
MRIFIITMEDPLYTLPFIKDIIKERKSEVIGVAISEAGRLKIAKDRSLIVYMFSLLLIMGIRGFVKNVVYTVAFIFTNKLSRYLPVKNLNLYSFCTENKIPVYRIKSPNNPNFLKILKQENPDIIINQSQYIIKRELLLIPKLGMLNRHNALLPKNRGRLTPFWVLYKEEKETGVSIHFIEEGIDSGPIVVQEKYTVSEKDDFNSLVRKNYQLASNAMLKALKIIESGNYHTLPNNDAAATYNTVPTFKEALKYRLKRTFGIRVNGILLLNSSVFFYVFESASCFAM